MYKRQLEDGDDGASAQSANHTSLEGLAVMLNTAPEKIKDLNHTALVNIIRNVFQAIVKLASGALTIAGATATGVGATVGLVVGAANTGVSAIRGLARSGKAFFKFLNRTRGKNRAINAKKLVELAMVEKDEDAAKMLLEMDLGMIFWSAEHAFKRAMTGPQATGAHTLRKMGMIEEESLKGADGKQLKNGKDGATPQDLIDVLAVLKENMGSSDPDTKIAAERQYNGLKNEVMGAMRSVV